MGVITQTYINLNTPIRLKINEFLDIISEIESEKLTSFGTYGVISNISDESFYHISVRKGKRLISGDKFIIEYWGKDREMFDQKIEEIYSDKDFVLFLGGMNERLKNQLEYGEWQVEIPLLLFCFREKRNVKLIDPHWDKELADEMGWEYEEGYEGVKYMKDTCLYLLIQNKGAPSADEIIETDLGKYFIRKYDSEIISVFS